MRIGPKMRLVAWYVCRNPGLPMINAAAYVGPHQSLKFGYEIVHRAIDAGIVERRPGPGNSWLLFPIDSEQQ